MPHSLFQNLWFGNFVFMIVLFSLALESPHLGTSKLVSWSIYSLSLYPHFRWSSYWYRNRSAIFGGGTTRRYFRNHEHINWIIVCYHLGMHFLNRIRMCHTCICIGGNFEWLVHEWVPIFRAQVYQWGGFWKCRAAHPYQNDPLVPREVTSDDLSNFDAIYMIIPAYTSVCVLFLKQN